MRSGRTGTGGGQHLSWIGDERIAVSGLPTAAVIRRLPQEGVTHVVNCCARVQTWLARDRAAERRVFGLSHVVHAPMWDFGRPQHPRLWSPAVRFADEALDSPDNRVLIHCQGGRRRSVLVTYAVLRLRGRTAEDAAALIVRHRTIAQIVPAYQDSVERWLAHELA